MEKDGGGRMSDWMEEYPRPMLRRESFFCLNGAWTLNGQTIQVPFPPQSKLSGWEGDVPEELRYTRRFTLPEGFSRPGERVRLHFGAVDQLAVVLVNGDMVTYHEGGYLPFWADVTDRLVPGENEVVVWAFDHLDKRYPYGKQSLRPGGMWYTPVSGIWQTVWLESVPENCVEGLRVTPSLDSVTIEVDCPVPRCTLTIAGMPPREIPTRRPVVIRLREPHLWTPDDPYLYDFTVTAGGDTVRSYFALRTVGIRGKRILLNGRPVFLHGVLDQGYFPDGLFLPAAPDGYDEDVRRMKELGFNLLRKHIKVEPERFYDACDRLGMLVMQDMVNSGGYHYLTDTVLPNIGLRRRPDTFPRNEKRKAFFERHCRNTVRRVFNHPCVIGYTIFNEGWGQFEADRLYRELKAVDPTRFWDATSGWFAQHESDVDSQHVYFRNKTLRRKDRPLFISECGGYARPVAGHLYKPGAKYGYGTADSEESLTDRIALLCRETLLPSIAGGLCGSVYTQVSDVEEEVNGLYTYDREVCKVNPTRMRLLAEELFQAYEKAASSS